MSMTVYSIGTYLMVCLSSVLIASGKLTLLSDGRGWEASVVRHSPGFQFNAFLTLS